MVALRRLLLLAALLGSVLCGYVFSAGTPALHAAMAGHPNIPCGSGPFSC
jgi:hypothetical protein